MTRRTPTPASTSTSTPTPTKISKKHSPNVGEVAGGTAANIFVVCCCCPCGLAECLITAAYKLPVNMVRRLWRKHQRRKKLAAAAAKKKKAGSKKRGLLEQANNGSAENSERKGKGNGDGNSGGGAQEHCVGSYCDEGCDDVEMKEFEKMNKVSIDGSEEEEFDTRMWDQFCNTGFWRTSSQRHINSTTCT